MNRDPTLSILMTVAGVILCCPAYAPWHSCSAELATLTLPSSASGWGVF